MSVEVAIEFKDERSITIPAEGDNSVVQQIVNALSAASREGYRLKAVNPIQEERGNQRDPYTVTTGVKIVLERGKNDKPRPVTRDRGVIPR